MTQGHWRSGSKSGDDLSPLLGLFLVFVMFVHLFTNGNIPCKCCTVHVLSLQPLFCYLGDEMLKYIE